MKIKLLVLSLVLCLLCGCGVHENHSNASKQESEYNTEKDTEESSEPYVLEFKANTIDGEPVTSEVFSKSKLTMINVWATYCPPCIEEMPDLGEISKEYDAEEFQIIGVISDVMEISTSDEKQKAIDIIEKTKANYPHLLLNDDLYYNMVGASNSVPTPYFVNEKGEMLGYLVGAQSKENWKSIINELLKEL